MGYGYCVALDWQGYVVACAEMNDRNKDVIEKKMASWYGHRVMKTYRPVEIGEKIAEEKK